jgi:Mn-dependent DtxR family transcriptional regulator
MSKEDMADFLDISRATVFRCITEAEKNDLIERTERGGLRATRKWIDAVEVYTIKKR